MPGFNGTGPRRQGPMTGAGQGFCARPLQPGTHTPLNGRMGWQTDELPRFGRGPGSAANDTNSPDYGKFGQREQSLADRDVTIAALRAELSELRVRIEALKLPGKGSTEVTRSVGGREDTMKLCITAQGHDWDSTIDPAFGRARAFLLVDSDAKQLEPLENKPGAHGAGIQAAQSMVESNVQAVITGNVGPNAFHALHAAGIDVYTGASGTVRDALAAFEAGTLRKTAAPTQGRHGG